MTHQKAAKALWTYSDKSSQMLEDQGCLLHVALTKHWQQNLCYTNENCVCVIMPEKFILILADWMCDLN